MNHTFNPEVFWNENKHNIKLWKLNQCSDDNSIACLSNCDNGELLNIFEWETFWIIMAVELNIA